MDDASSFHSVQESTGPWSRALDDVEPDYFRKPWLAQRETRMERLAVWIPRASVILAAVIIAVFAYGGYNDYETRSFCLVFEDSFDSFDETVWQREVELGGYGTGEFEWTTPFENNSYVKDGKLHLVPHVSAWPPAEGTVLNLTDLGICTVDNAYSGRSPVADCQATYNTSLGTVIPPISSARLSTRLSHSIHYGRVEVTAKLPVGDWLWPAIWMMPTNNTYGKWPQSGEIDIMESRGNGVDFISVNEQQQHFPGGHDATYSTLHWGPAIPYIYDAWAKTTDGMRYPSGLSSLTSGYHVYGIEWSPRSIRTYVDKKLTRVAHFKFPEGGFWGQGDFDAGRSAWSTESFLNPWTTGSSHAPFDQDFHLIINLAVGATNGYFNTISGLLPWSGSRNEAIQGFMKARERWEPSWKSESERAFTIDSVRMWKLC
ncbi:concanavalin A-like lectin/glucanase domain-containing protein [Protomyces lactucae-debilis]|uniref:Concanavalin A-like lectin/glucanase domain-containing protein n=1 Tax=Protomyces lactucae-debilis TaxID=2754530 RepID=A0A1Y2FES7_PROLT|nr:concanavalin A-like lectin/glucanase domain-containing protein [Protomyces lactucae-debilis]ORY82429.1 concanavalin A-like lectin/glucanase domain-containing protein [Protomyces lactucae-debilis]